MGHPLRNKDPELYRLITIRTEGAALFMRPSKDINKIIGGIIARYSEILKIEIYAYIFLSNHFHLLIRAPKKNTDEFMENVDREIARRVNWKLRRTGKFWSRRYDDQKCLSEDDIIEAFLYVTTNGVRHGLEKDPAKWPGLNSYSQCLSETKREFSFYHYSAREDEKKVTYHTLKLKPLPQFSHLSKAGRTERLKELLAERAKKLAEERTLAGLGFLGAETVRIQDPFTIPLSVAKHRRPVGYSRNIALKRAYRKAQRMVKILYREASMRFRHGCDKYHFPQFTYLPPLHRKARIFHFCPLPEDYFKISV